LERIGITETVRADYSTLRLIQERHMLSVPFENLNIMYGLPIELDLDSLYDKIVVKRRGGYCYELNGLLAWSLRSLGFEVSLLSAQVRRDDGTFGPEFDHLALLVKLDQDYMVDVGFGDSVRHPLPLSGEEVADVSGTYRIVSKSDSDRLFFQKKQHGEWVSEFQFSLKPRQIDDFREANMDTQTSSESQFTQNLILSLATPTGRISVSRDSVTETIGSTKNRRPVQSEEVRNEFIKSYFGIDCSLLR
jgi:N-hydroxyarylamine O-acetyltransferase